MTTKTEREAWARLAEAATPGPWGADEDRCAWVGGAAVMFVESGKPTKMCEASESDAAFIAAARTAVPALLDENEAMRALLKSIEWSGGEGAWICPVCRAYAGLSHNGPDGNHEPGCALAAFLRET